MPESLYERLTVDSAREKLLAGMTANGCLCLYGRCSIHGEGTGLLASAYFALDAQARQLQEAREALRWAHSFLCAILFKELANRGEWPPKPVAKLREPTEIEQVLLAIDAALSSVHSER